LWDFVQVQWEIPLEEEGGAVVGMEWRVEVEAVVVGRYDGQVVTICPETLNPDLTGNQRSL
jgi:hypothetical protein